MSQHYYSVEQVAELLGLHVRTVRGYVRDGRLKAVRIGKQYRIAREDLEAFTGTPPTTPPTTRPATPSAAARHTEASTIVQIDAVGPDTAHRLTTLVTASVSGRPYDGGPLRVETVYDQARATLKVVILGGLADTAELLRLIDALAGQADDEETPP